MVIMIPGYWLLQRSWLLPKELGNFLFPNPTYQSHRPHPNFTSLLFSPTLALGLTHALSDFLAAVFLPPAQLESREPSGLGPTPARRLRLPPVRPLLPKQFRFGFKWLPARQRQAEAMPARSRHRPRLHSGSPPRAPPPPLEELHSGEARRARDSDSGSDADSELGRGSPTRTAEVSGS